MKEHLFQLGFAAVSLATVAMAAAVSQRPIARAQDRPLDDELKGKRIAILVANGFEQSELLEPKKALDAAGARTSIVSPESKEVKSWTNKNWGEAIAVDVPLDGASVQQFDALLLPGGVMNPDTLRMNPKAVGLVKAFAEADKPIAAICHGPWTLVEADLVRGKTLTSWPSLKTDVRNAGGNWVDEEVVVDKNLVTSRKPADIPAFNRAMIALFARRK
jgi:protease I